jgi:hypothetical protein
MKAILQKGAGILLCLVLLYLSFLGVALSLDAHPSQGPGLDASAADDTIFMTEPKYIYLHRTPLRNNSQKVIILGASNADIGFKLSELRPLLPTTVFVNKLAIGGANMTEIRQVIDLVQQIQSPQARRREIFVLGIWYGDFGQDRLRWYTPDRSPGDTDIDIERYRYGFEWRTAHGPVPIVPWRYFDAAVIAVYPFLFLDELSRDGLEWLSHGYQAQLPDLDTAVMPAGERDRMMNYWSRLMGPASPSALGEQFAVLEQICEQILADGSKLVLVDLPLPKWHKQRSPYESYYEHETAQLLKRWTGQSGFSFLDMTDMDSDADFYDEVHPRPRVTIAWSRRLAAAISPLLSPAAAVAGVEGSSSESPIP